MLSRPFHRSAFVSCTGLFLKVGGFEVVGDQDLEILGWRSVLSWATNRDQVAGNCDFWGFCIFAGARGFVYLTFSEVEHSTTTTMPYSISSRDRDYGQS